LQFDEVYEVILVEDKSPDNALEVCKILEKEHERVKLFLHHDKGNHGAGESRNLGIEKASGDFIAFLDADDYYLPNRFDVEKELFKNPEVEGVYGAIGVEYYSEKAKEQYYHLYKNDLTTVYKKQKPEDVFPGLIYLRGAFGMFSLDALTIRKSSLQKLDYLFLKNLRLHQDTEFINRMSFYLQLHYGSIEKAVSMRGVHEENRITTVESKKVKPAKTKVILWRELFHWAKAEPKMPKNYLRQIKNFKNSFEIANASSFSKLFLFLKYFVSDYLIIKGVFRRNYL